MSALILAGCGDDETTSEEGTSPTTEQTADQPETTEDTGDATEGPTDGAGTGTGDATEEATDDPTDDPTDTGDATGAAPVEGNYPDEVAGLNTWAAENSGVTEDGECPLATLDGATAAAQSAGLSDLTVESWLVEAYQDQFPEGAVAGVTCTGTATPEGAEVGVAMLTVGGGLTVEEFLELTAQEDLESVGPGPDGQGELLVFCDDEICGGIWHDVDLLVVTMLNADGANESQITDFTNELLPDALASAASFS